MTTHYIPRGGMNVRWQPKLDGTDLVIEKFVDNALREEYRIQEEVLITAVITHLRQLGYTVIEP